MKVFGTIEVIGTNDIEVRNSKEWDCGEGCCSEIEYETKYYSFGEVLEINESHILGDNTLPEFSTTEVIMKSLRKDARVVYTHDEFGDAVSVRLELVQQS